MCACQQPINFFYFLKLGPLNKVYFTWVPFDQGRAHARVALRFLGPVLACQGQNVRGEAAISTVLGKGTHSIVTTQNTEYIGMTGTSTDLAVYPCFVGGQTTSFVAPGAGITSSWAELGELTPLSWYVL